MNRSEEITYELCKKSFLSLWSFANPLRGDGKELCDILVMFDPHLVIFSVKEIQYAWNVDEAVALKRWERRAIDRSARQIYNAQSWITQNRAILTSEKKPISIPDLGRAKIHRVAVALGSKGKVSVGLSASNGRGYIHVYDEVTIHRTLRELDTITDFVEYLTAVESLLMRGTKVTLIGGQDDLLALYLQNNRSFPDKFDMLVVDEGTWERFESRQEVKWRKEEDQISYVWDGIIEKFSQDVQEGTLEYESTPGETELVLRTMAGENRFNRRLLSQQIDDMLKTTPKTGRRAKLLQSPSGIVYVLLASEKERYREDRRIELEARCYVARNIFPNSPIVVGIATECYDPAEPAGRSFDACYLRFEEWSTEHQEKARELQEKLGFFAKDEQKQIHVDEYPDVDKTGARTRAKGPIDIRTEKFQVLQQRFPITLEHLMQLKEFEVIARQLTFEGYKDWEILQAGCNIIVNYRIDPEGKSNPEELADRLKEYTANYVETAYSPFPPTEFFVLKRVRGQIHADRVARLARSKEIDEGIRAKDVEEHREPQNCLYARTKDNYDLWMVLFPKFVPGAGEVSISEEWRIKIGCDFTDSVSFRFCEDLAHDLAKYATMIDFWLNQLHSTRKEELNIAVVEEKLFKKLFPKAYFGALEGRPEMTDIPIIMSGRDNNGKPIMKLGVNERILQQPRMRRLFYAMCGILDCIGGIPKPDAAEKAAQLVGTLEDVEYQLR